MPRTSATGKGSIVKALNPENIKLEQLDNPDPSAGTSLKRPSKSRNSSIPLLKSKRRQQTPTRVKVLPKKCRRRKGSRVSKHNNQSHHFNCKLCKAYYFSKFELDRHLYEVHDEVSEEVRMYYSLKDESRIARRRKRHNFWADKRSPVWPSNFIKIGCNPRPVNKSYLWNLGIVFNWDKIKL